MAGYRLILFKLCRQAAHWPPMMVCFLVLQIKSQTKAAVTFEGISVVYRLILIKFYCRHTANWATIMDGLSFHISVQIRCVYAALIGACVARKTTKLLSSFSWIFILGKLLTWESTKNFVTLSLTGFQFLLISM